MFLRLQKRVQDDQEESMEETKQRLVQDVFGREEDINVVLPPPERIVALLWLYREDESVLQYLCQLVENHAMNQPTLVDVIEIYMPQLIQLALQWDPTTGGGTVGSNKKHNNNKVERLLLILAQLSTRFAIQYHWNLQNLLEDLQLECTQSRSGRPNSKFDMEYYASCMLLAGDLERCMSGKRRPERKPVVPQLEITTSYGGKVTNDEVLPMKDETNQSFFDAIVTTADDNVGSALSPGETESVATLDTPLKKTFGGVLLFKRVHRKGARRKTWKERYFAIEESMLNCYSRERKLLRSMSLEGATIWKGLQQDKYPHSFVVTNSNTMFHLRASSEEQKSIWKHKLREAITTSTLPDDLAESQKERHKKYQNAKWFGRTLLEITNDLDYAPSSERKQLLEDALYELEMPQEERMSWPWNEHDGSPEKSIFTALPHFSHLVSSKISKKSSSLPRFQAGFMVKRDETVIMSSPYERFLQQGRQKKCTSSGPLVIPDAILTILRATGRPIMMSATGVETLKDVDGGSITGASTEGLSDESNISGYNSTVSESVGPDHNTRLRKDGNGVATKDCMPGGAESQVVPSTVPINSLKRVSDLTFDSFDVTKAEGEANEGVNESPPRLRRSTTKESDIEASSVDQGRNQSVELVLRGTPLPPKDDNNNNNNNNLDDQPVELVLKGTPLPPKDDNNNLDDDDTESASDEFNSEGDSGAEGDVESNMEGTNGQPEGSEIVSEECSTITMTTAAARRASFFDKNNTARRSSFFDSESSVSFGMSSESKGLASLRTKLHRPEEMLAAQLGQFYESFFAASMIWIRAPRLRRMSRDMMIVEVPRNGFTLAEAKESLEEGEGLMDYFIATHGSPESESFQRAQTCFVQSLAGLFLLSYLLGVKNRREDNLMLDKEGHIFASDYAAVFECEGSKVAPLKLTGEYLEIMGGPSSSSFQFFRCLIVSGLKRAREDAASTLGLLQLVPGSAMTCKQRDNAVQYLRQKLMLDASEELTEKRMRRVIEQSRQRHFASPSSFRNLSKTRLASTA